VSSPAGNHPTNRQPTSHEKP